MAGFSSYLDRTIAYPLQTLLSELTLNRGSVIRHVDQEDTQQLIVLRSTRAFG